MVYIQSSIIVRKNLQRVCVTSAPALRGSAFLSAVRLYGIASTTHGYQHHTCMSSKVLQSFSCPSCGLFHTGRRGYCEVAPEEKSVPKVTSDASSENQLVAMSVAVAVNKIKRQHQQATEASERRKMELEAWSQLNALSEDAIMIAEGKAVALLLNSWAYFSKHWERGRDGPETGVKDSVSKKSTDDDDDE